MAIVPYLHFQGTCAEAMTFYRDVFDGTDLKFQYFGDAPAGVMPSGSDARVLHSQMNMSGGQLMASDFPDGIGEAQKAVSLMHGVSDADEGVRIFDLLLEGGDVIMPFEENFFSKGFGMVRDKFGSHWMISVIEGAH